MYKLMMKLQRNKFIMICLSLFICFSLLLNISSTAVRPRAVSEVVLGATLYVLASLCLSLGINIAVNNINLEPALQALYDHLAELDLVDEINRAAAVWSFSYCTYWDWSSASYQDICTEIINYFNGLDNSGGVVVGVITPTNSSRVGFTESTKFSITFPAGAFASVYNFPSSTLTIYDDCSKSVLPSSPFLNPVNSNSNGNSAYFIVNSDGFGFAAIFQNSRYSFTKLSGKTLNANLYSNHIGDCLSASNTIRILDISEVNTTAGYQWAANYFYDTNTGYSYYLKQVSNSEYHYCNVADGSYYNNLTFQNKLSAVDWFRNSCGFCTTTLGSDIVYTDNPYIDTSSAIDYDSTTATQNLNDVINSGIDSLPTVIANDLTSLGIIADNPSLVTDVSAASAVIPLYPDELPKIDTKLELWQTKFPFCLPWDIYNLFSVFSAEPEAPEFHILVVPSNSFGLDIDDQYVDFDFEDYNTLVLILRFFFAAAFVLWLILITPKVIKH